MQCMQALSAAPPPPQVRAPGSAEREALVQPPGRASGAQSERAALLAAWQRALGALLPGIAGDALEEVLAARPDRVVLLTRGHVAYLAAHRAPGAAGWSYSPRWALRRELIVHVRGVEEQLRLNIEYQRPVAAGRFSVRVPLRRSFRCASREAYTRLVVAVGRALGRASGGGGPQAPPPAGEEGGEERALVELSLARPGARR
jgi:hypothetical protein